MGARGTPEDTSPTRFGTVRYWLRVIPGMAKVALLGEPAGGRIDGQRDLHEWRDR